MKYGGFLRGPPMSWSPKTKAAGPSFSPAGWLDFSRVKIGPCKSNPPDAVQYPLLFFLGKTLQGDMMRERPQKMAGRVKDITVKMELTGSLWRETEIRLDGQGRVSGPPPRYHVCSQYGALPGRGSYGIGVRWSKLYL